MRGISWFYEALLVSQEELCCMDVVTVQWKAVARAVINTCSHSIEGHNFFY